MWHWRNGSSEEVDTETGQPEVHGLLRDLKNNRVEPSPYFAKRVMAAIEAQEAEVARRTRAWAAVPGFASRLAAVAGFMLLVAGTWLYEGAIRRPVATGGIFEDSAAAAASSSQDDVFVVPSEETR